MEYIFRSSACDQHVEVLVYQPSISGNTFISRNSFAMVTTTVTPLPRNLLAVYRCYRVPEDTGECDWTQGARLTVYQRSGNDFDQPWDEEEETVVEEFAKDVCLEYGDLAPMHHDQGRNLSA